MWASPAPAADSAHCNSKPFTLKKPAPMPAKPAAAPTPPAAKPAAIKPHLAQGHARAEALYDRLQAAAQPLIG